MLFNAHDIGVALQFLLLISVAFGLRTLSRQSPPGLSKATFATGVGAVIFVVLLVLLGVGSKIVSNGFYMLPQGIFGIWLIVVNLALVRITPRVAKGAWNDCRVGSRTCWDYLRWNLFYLSGHARYTRGAPGECQGGEFRCKYLFPSTSLLFVICGCYHTTYLDCSDRFSTAQEKAPCRPHRIDRFPHCTRDDRMPCTLISRD
jgi:hypothetical protein